MWRTSKRGTSVSDTLRVKVAGRSVTIDLGHEITRNSRSQIFSAEWTDGTKTPELVAKVVKLDDEFLNEFYQREVAAYDAIYPELVDSRPRPHARPESIVRCFGHEVVETDNRRVGIIILEYFPETAWSSARRRSRGSAERIALVRRVAHAMLDASGYLDATVVGAWRDAQPMNVFVDSTRAVAADFSHAYLPSAFDTSGTQIGMLEFLAPELIDQDGDASANVISDLWSICMTVYVLLAVKGSRWDASAELPWVTKTGERATWPGPRPGQVAAVRFPTNQVALKAQIREGIWTIDLTAFDEICPDATLRQLLELGLVADPTTRAENRQTARFRGICEALAAPLGESADSPQSNEDRGDIPETGSVPPGIRRTVSRSISSRTLRAGTATVPKGLGRNPYEQRREPIATAFTQPPPPPMIRPFPTWEAAPGGVVVVAAAMLLGLVATILIALWTDGPWWTVEMFAIAGLAVLIAAQGGASTLPAQRITASASVVLPFGMGLAAWYVAGLATKEARWAPLTILGFVMAIVVVADSSPITLVLAASWSVVGTAGPVVLAWGVERFVLHNAYLDSWRQRQWTHGPWALFLLSVAMVTFILLTFTLWAIDEIPIAKAVLVLTMTCGIALAGSGVVVAHRQQAGIGAICVPGVQLHPVTRRACVPIEAGWSVSSAAASRAFAKTVGWPSGDPPGTGASAGFSRVDLVNGCVALHLGVSSAASANISLDRPASHPLHNQSGEVDASASLQADGGVVRERLGHTTYVESPLLRTFGTQTVAQVFEPVTPVGSFGQMRLMSRVGSTRAQIWLIATGQCALSTTSSFTEQAAVRSMLSPMAFRASGCVDEAYFTVLQPQAANPSWHDICVPELDGLTLGATKLAGRMGYTTAELPAQVGTDTTVFINVDVRQPGNRNGLSYRVLHDDNASKWITRSDAWRSRRPTANRVEYLRTFGSGVSTITVYIVQRGGTSETDPTGVANSVDALLARTKLANG
jgi:serine/threonine protein kinase